MIHNPIQMGKKIDNRVVLQPMEGCDCNTDRSPSELTVKKYSKAAKILGADILRLWCGRKNGKDMTDEERSNLLSVC